MSHKPRTRDNFPRMKDRAYGRRNRVSQAYSAAQVVAALAGIRQIGLALADAGRIMTDAMVEITRVIGGLFTSEQTTVYWGGVLKRMKLHDNEIAKSVCHSCGYEMDCASESNGTPKAPKTGDYSICFKCAAVGRFIPNSDGVMQITAPLDEEHIPQEVVSMHLQFLHWRLLHPWGEDHPDD